jgi:hypothetical protein
MDNLLKCKRQERNVGLCFEMSFRLNAGPEQAYTLEA